MRVTIHAGLVLALMLLASPRVLAQTGDAWLGCSLQVVEAADAKKMGIEGGLKVTKVDNPSPAKEAGLEAGDIILSAGQSTVTTIEAMRDILKNKRPGDLLSLGVRRSNGRNEPLMVTLGSVADKDDRFKDDAKVKELREKLRGMDAERRKVAEELERRLEDLRSGKANKSTEPELGPKVEEPKAPENKPKTIEPERTTLTVSIGASFVNLTPEESRKLGIEGGIKATTIAANGAAAESGLKEDDIVTKAGGEAVSGTGHLRTLLGKLNPGDKLELEVLRAGKKVTLNVVLRPKT